MMESIGPLYLKFGQGGYHFSMNINKLLKKKTRLPTPNKNATTAKEMANKKWIPFIKLARKQKANKNCTAFKGTHIF